MKVVVYGMPGCQNCKKIKEEFLKRKIDFNYTEDYQEMLKMARKHRIKTAPVIDYHGEFFGFEEIMKKLA